MEIIKGFYFKLGSGLMSGINPETVYNNVHFINCDFHPNCDSIKFINCKFTNCDTPFDLYI